MRRGNRIGWYSSNAIRPHCSCTFLKAQPDSENKPTRQSHLIFPSDRATPAASIQEAFADPSIDETIISMARVAAPRVDNVPT
jgi:hypothetical protein